MALRERVFFPALTHNVDMWTSLLKHVDFLLRSPPMFFHLLLLLYLFLQSFYLILFCLLFFPLYLILFCLLFLFQRAKQTLWTSELRLTCSRRRSAAAPQGALVAGLMEH